MSAFEVLAQKGPYWMNLEVATHEYVVWKDVGLTAVRQAAFPVSDEGLQAARQCVETLASKEPV